jgi:hypothetical protein
LRLRTFRIPFLVAILLVSWLPLSSLKIVSDKALQSQDQTATGLGPNGDKNSTNSQRFLRI